MVEDWGFPLWVLLMYVQSVFGLFTIRARNSKNYLYNAASTIFLNLIVYAQSFLFLSGIIPAVTSNDIEVMVRVSLWGTAAITAGVLTGQWLALNKVETKC